MWEFFAKFAPYGYDKTPAVFCIDLLKLKLPELLKTEEDELQLEKKLRNFIKQDERVPIRLLRLLERLLVSTL